jgi:hypothetical protein
MTAGLVLVIVAARVLALTHQFRGGFTAKTAPRRN